MDNPFERFLATVESAKSLVEHRVLAGARRIEELDQFFIGQAFDFAGSHQRRVTAGVANLLTEPLEILMARRLVWQQVGRSLNLDRPRLLEFAPDSDSLGFVGGRQSEKQQEPG